MSESESKSAAPHPAGVYVKGDDIRVANTAGRGAALAFDGYTRQSDSVADVVEPVEAPDAPVEVAQVNEAKPTTAPKPTPPAKTKDNA